MQTAKRKALIDSFLESLDTQTRPVFHAILAHLSALGYHPQKVRDNITFKHSAHSKQIAKLKRAKGAAVFALRFSACRGYSQRFAAVVDAWAAKYPTRTAMCPGGSCKFCAGAPDTHTYPYNADGERKAFCGAYALEIPQLSAQDVPEITALITQEHAYLMEHEAGGVV